MQINNYKNTIDKDKITERDLRVLLKEARLLLPESSKYYQKKVRLPRNNKILFVFFSIYKLYSMLQCEYFRDKLQDKKYVSEDVIHSDIGEYKTKKRYELVFFSQKMFNDSFGIPYESYAPYVELFCTPFSEYQYKKYCRLYEWNDLAHQFFAPLIQAWREEKFKFPEEYLNLMNNIDTSDEKVIPELQVFLSALKAWRPKISKKDLLNSEYNEFTKAHYHIKNNEALYDKCIEYNVSNMLTHKKKTWNKLSERYI